MHEVAGSNPVSLICLLTREEQVMRTFDVWVRVDGQVVDRYEATLNNVASMIRETYKQHGQGVEIEIRFPRPVNTDASCRAPAVVAGE
jgi:hypothetical protein